ncbi:MAG: energy transducer TonB [Sphingobium sp.]
MAYADHSETSSRTVSLVIVALIHVVLGYAFVTGLGMKYVKKAAEQLNVIDVKEEPPPPDEPPPPPPKPTDVPPPPVITPPPAVVFQAPPVNVAPPPPPVFVTQAPPPPAPPPPPGKATRAAPKSNPGTWFSDDDYPQRAQREGAHGTTGFRLDVGPDGRVTGCTVTSSSGNSELDETTCRLAPRRARFKPAMGTDKQPMSDSYSGRVTWKIPE